MPLCNYDVLRNPIRFVDIDLINDDTNLLAPPRRAQNLFAAMNLGHKIEKAQVANPSFLETTDNTPTNSTPSTSRVPSSSRSTQPILVLLSIARVQKF